MKLVDFPERNVIFAEDQPQYLPLPAHRALHDLHGRVTCCWVLSFRERLQVLFIGRIWHQVLTFNNPLQPQLLLTTKPDLR